MECVDFSVQNDTSLPTRSTRGSLTPTIKPKRDKNPLGNLNGLLSLSAKVLNISHKVDQVSIFDARDRGERCSGTELKERKMVETKGGRKENSGEKEQEG